MRAPDDELLRPTLTADLDVRRFGALYAPQSILWPTFFGGPLAGGILFGMNYARMGRRDLARWTWIAATVIAMAVGIGVAAYILSSAGNHGAADSRLPRGARYVVSGLSVAVGWFVAKHQERRFAAWVSADNQPARLWLPGFAAWFVGALVVVGSALLTFLVVGDGI